jgi:hypothetical protein
MDSNPDISVYAATQAKELEDGGDEGHSMRLGGRVEEMIWGELQQIRGSLDNIQNEQ